MKLDYKVKIENIQQLNIVLKSENVKEIIISRDSFAEKNLIKLTNEIKSKGKSPWILMERISRFEEKPMDLRISTDKLFEIKNLDGIIVQNLDSFAYTLRKINKVANENLKVELNYTMNCYNDETKKVYQNLYNEKRNNASVVPLLFTAPVELNIYELSEVGYDTMIVYSYIDTMVSANCLRKNLAVSDTIRPHRTGELHEPTKRICDLHEPTCKNRFNFENVHDFSSYIIDRKGKKLHYKTYCKYCYNKIFNTEPIYLLDKIDEFKTVGEKLHEPTYRIDFSFETENEVRDILNKKIPESFTRGHIKNSIK